MKQQRKAGRPPNTPLKQPGSQDKAASRKKTPEAVLPSKRKAGELPRTPVKEPVTDRNCTLTAIEPSKEQEREQGDESRALEPTSHEPTVQQDKSSTALQAAEETQSITMQQWQAMQDLAALGQHLSEAHEAYQQGCDNIHMFLE